MLTISTSPGFAASAWSLANSRVLAPVGSSIVICAWRSTGMGSLKSVRTVGTSGYTWNRASLSSREPRVPLVGQEAAKKHAQEHNIRCRAVSMGLETLGASGAAAVASDLCHARCCLACLNAVLRHPNGRPTAAKFIVAELRSVLLELKRKMMRVSKTLKAKRIAKPSPSRTL